VISDDLCFAARKDSNTGTGIVRWSQRLKSIIAEVGTDEFIRLRIGIQPESSDLRCETVCARSVFND
jgi:peptidyl-tRNA hydrolase